ncbi:restriction endonuclease subunit S [Aeromonas caviae]|uniref:restriction endonuclease subunit S n=1 Tax=Aeromonas caviae TaxID=648 RepID=UPI000D6869AD|nr:restriction endonuclease subunit S [Aeromonas caviae]
MSSEWISTTLGEVTSWMSGGTPKKDVAAYWNGDIPWISANSMYGTRYSDSDLRITREGLANGSRLAPESSVLLLVRGGALHNRIPVGIATREVAFNQDVKALLAKRDRLNPWYLLFWLMGQERFLLDSVVEFTGIGAGKLDTQRMQALPFLLPKLEEQNTIVALAKGIDDRIALLRETNATLEAIAQALFKSWFVDFDPVHARARGEQPAGLAPEVAALFPDSFEESELGMVPKGWKLQPLAEAYEINPTRKLKKGEVAAYLDMASVATSGHTVTGVVGREMGSGTKFVNGDTLLARITPCLENGKTAFVDFLVEEQTGWGSTEFVVLRPKAPLPPYHGYLMTRHPAFREHAIQSMSGTSGRQRVQNDVLGLYRIVIPTPDVANAFGDVVNEVQASIAANHQQAQTLATLRDTLLPRLISGQLRLPEAESLVEATL